MTPREYLELEIENIECVLNDTLRRDHGPNRSQEFYEECRRRLELIKSQFNSSVELDEGQRRLIHSTLRVVGWQIGLIERSYLGEFSWSFAEEFREMAKSLLAEKDFMGDEISPIISIIAGAEPSYKVYEFEKFCSTVAKSRLVIAEFPRSLKHHVLFHAVLGHELCHSILEFGENGKALQSKAVSALMREGPLSSIGDFDRWIASVNQSKSGEQQSERKRASWLRELICDLFGILLFGPSFLAAFKACIRPLTINVYLTDTDHPPFATRYAMLVKALRISGWSQPVTAPATTIHAMECEMLEYISAPSYDSNFDILSDSQIEAATLEIKNVLESSVRGRFVSPSADRLDELVSSISRAIPPVGAAVDEGGAIRHWRIEMPQILYGGWIAWLGRAKRHPEPSFDFLTINKLCEHAIMQQREVNRILDNGPI